MENRPKPKKHLGHLFGASDSASFISQNLMNAQGVSTENPGMKYFYIVLQLSTSVQSRIFTNSNTCSDHDITLHSTKRYIFLVPVKDIFYNELFTNILLKKLTLWNEEIEDWL